MAITVKIINLSRFKLTDKAIMRELGQTALRLSRERIEAGIGSDGAPMRAPASVKDINIRGTYSQAWSDIRQYGEKRQRYSTVEGQKVGLLTKTGRRSFGKFGGGRTVDIRTLVFTGRMIAARFIKTVTATTALISFRGAEVKKAEGNQLRTPFVKLTPSERADIVQMARELIAAKLRNQQAAERAAKGPTS